jgi:hypothetical protein
MMITETKIKKKTTTFKPVIIFLLIVNNTDVVNSLGMLNIEAA